MMVEGARSVRAALGIEPDDGIHADADPHEVRRQLVEVHEGLVPGHEPQVAIEDRDALPRIVDGVLEQVAALLDRCRRIVQELERILGRNRAPPQEQGQGEPRRGGADGGGEQVLRIAQGVDVRLGLAFESLAAAMRETLEGTRRPLLAEVPHHRRPQLVHRDARAKQAEAGRRVHVRLAHEHVRLHPLHRRHGTPEGTCDVGHDVEGQAPDHPMGQLRQLDAEQGRRLEGGQAERARHHGVGPDHAVPDEARQQERVGPGDEADRKAGAGAECRSPRPDQPSQERGSDLRDRREGQRPMAASAAWLEPR